MLTQASKLGLKILPAAHCPLIQSISVTSSGEKEQHEADSEPLEELEIISAFQIIRNRKSSGEDEIPQEILKPLLS